MRPISRYGAPSIAHLLVLSAVVLASACSSARRQAPVAPAPPPPPAAVGTWSLTVETPQGTQQPVLTISGTAQSLSGVLSGELGQLELADVLYAEGTLTFKTTIDFQGQVLDLDFAGTVDGDGLSGSFDTPFGQIPAIGTRTAP